MRDVVADRPLLLVTEELDIGVRLAATLGLQVELGPDLQRAGKIRAFGSSTYPAWRMVQAQWTASQRGLSRFTTEQPPYSMLIRNIEADVLPVAQEYGMGVIPWSPLAGGLLSGRYRIGAGTPSSSRADRVPSRYDQSDPSNQAKFSAADALGALADETGISLIQMAIAFVMQHPAVTAPIIGPRTMAHLDSQLAALDVTLGADVLDRIDEIVPPGTTFRRDDEGYTPPSLQDPARRRRR